MQILFFLYAVFLKKIEKRLRSALERKIAFEHLSCKTEDMYIFEIAHCVNLFAASIGEEKKNKKNKMLNDVDVPPEWYDEKSGEFRDMSIRSTICRNVYYKKLANEEMQSSS